MEKYQVTEDIKVFYVTASSFPDGILPAFEQLKALLPATKDRHFYGLSRPENGRIVYKAAVQESYEGEAAKYNCDTFIIKKGEYASIVIDEFMKAPERVGDAFMELIHNVPGLDPQGYCVEVYSQADQVRCMIRMEG